MEATDEGPRVAEVFAIGLGECGSNLVGAYLKQARERMLPPRIRGYLCMNTDRSDITKLRQKYDIAFADFSTYMESLKNDPALKLHELKNALNQSDSKEKIKNNGLEI